MFALGADPVGRCFLVMSMVGTGRKLPGIRPGRLVGLTNETSTLYGRRDLANPGMYVVASPSQGGFGRNFRSTHRPESLPKYRSAGPRSPSFLFLEFCCWPTAMFEAASIVSVE